jgi:ribosomal protein L2
MPNIPTIDQLKRALHLQENIEVLQRELSSLFSSVGIKAMGIAESGMRAAAKMISGKKRTMSKAARAKIAAAQKLRWAKVKGKKAVTKVKRKKGKMSAAGRAAIVKAQKLRWAKVKAEKGKKA